MTRVLFPMSMLCVQGGIGRAQALAVGLAITAAALSGCKEKPQAVAPPPPEVSVTVVEQKDVPIYKEWVGTIDGNVNAQIHARVQGHLQSRDYVEGTLVRTGDLLFTIDARSYQAALNQAKGDLGRSEALLTKAQQDVTRFTPLAAEGAISQQELDNSIQAQRAAKAATDSARAAVETAQLNLEWTKVKAPIDGVAGIALANIGDLVNESTNLTTISQVNPVRVSFPIAEQEYLRLASRIELNAANQKDQGVLQLILADGSIHPQLGKFSVANRQVDIKTGTLMIIAVFPNPSNILRPGQYGKVRATVETRNGALLVPQRSVMEVQGNYQVAVVGSDNKVSMRTVKASDVVGNQWIVQDGVKAGERVIVEGLQKVRDGVTVNPKAAEAAAAK